MKNSRRYSNLTNNTCSKGQQVDKSLVSLTISAFESFREIDVSITNSTSSVVFCSNTTEILNNYKKTKAQNARSLRTC